MRLIAAALTLIITGCSTGSGPLEPEPQAPAPPPQVTVIYVGTSAVDTLLPNGCCSEVISQYIGAGFQIETLDAPCHGDDAPLCLMPGLGGWASEVAVGNREWLDRFCRRLESKIAGRPVFLAGTSRGAYSVLACNVGVPVRGIVGNAPLIDLYRLTEFQGVPSRAGFDLLPQRIPTLIRIGRNDERVGTQPAIDYAMQTGAQLQVVQVDGHVAPEDGTGIAFIREH